MTAFDVQNTDSPVTLIAGCGDVGGRLAKCLMADGHRVYGLRRDTSHLPKGVIPVQGDLAANMLGEWPDRIDYVVYCAAAGRQGEDGYRQTYIAGLEHVLSKLKTLAEPPQRIFFTSSTAVYHQQGGEWVDELSATHPENFNGKVMLEAETLLLNGTMPATVIRFGGIYGPGRNFMLKKVQQGEVYIESPVVYGNRIHSEDCAGMLAWLIRLEQNNQCVHPLYLGVDSEPAPLSEVTNWLAEQIGVKPVSETTVIRQSKRCRNKRILETGYALRYPSYRDGYKMLLKTFAG